MNYQEKSETFLPSPSESDDADLLLDAWRVCLAETLDKQQHAWTRHIEFMEAKSAAIIGQLEAKIATLETRIQSRLGELQDGDPGPEGPIGPIGEQGPQGDTGDDGERGFPGVAGEMGVRGERGLGGPVGLRGPRGEPGNRGERGERGAPGRTARDGKDGKDGERGKIGPVGLRGTRGEKGERGLQGEKGYGKEGKQGKQGPQGQQGQAGERGEQGERGETGEAGPQGQQGPQGHEGAHGERGYLGERGPQGEPGLLGPQGARGEQGEKGNPGLLPMVRAWAKDEISYLGTVVFHEGGSWQAQKDTAQAPPHRDWLPLAAAGRNAVNPIVRGTFDPASSYDALNVVAMNGSGFIARWNDPGECPGDGWQLIASAGRAGKPGPRGETGAQGLRGLPGASILRAEIEPKSFTIKFLMSDGGEIAVPCRGLFEQYHKESDG